MVNTHYGLEEKEKHVPFRNVRERISSPPVARLALSGLRTHNCSYCAATIMVVIALMNLIDFRRPRLFLAVTPEVGKTQGVSL
jgi:hypothetical protein